MRYQSFFLIVIFVSLPILGYPQDWESFYTGNKVSSVEISESALWIDTESSLVKMDLSNGDLEYHNYFDSVFVSQHFSDNPYLSLSINGESGAFVGNANNGLYQYINNRWVRIDSSMSGLPSNLFLSLKGDYQGHLWFKNGHNHLVKLYDTDSLEIYESADHSIQDYLIDTLGNPWLKTEIGLIHMVDDSVTLYDTTNTPWMHNCPYSALIDGNNALWVMDTLNRFDYSSSTYLYKYDGYAWTEFRSDSGEIPFNYLPWLLELGPDNKLWFVFSDKILLFDSNQWDTIQLSTNYSVTDIAIKSEVDFHLGAYPLGLLSYENGDEDIRPIADNTIPGEDIKSIAVEESGKVWLSAHALGGYNSGVSSYHEGVWSTNSGALNEMPGGPNSLCNLFYVPHQGLWALEAFEPAFLLENNVWSEIVYPYDRKGFLELDIDSQGTNWYLTTGGIGTVDNGSFNLQYQIQLSNQRGAFCIDHNDVMWAGDYFRLYRCENGVVESMTCNDSEIPCAPGFNDLAVDENNVIWIAGPGIMKYQDGIFTQYSIKHDDYIASDLVYSIAIDEDNVKYFGTYKGGVVRYDGQTWSSVNRSNSGINHNSVSSIIVDSSDVWAGTYDGLFRFSKEINGEIIEPLETVLTSVDSPFIIPGGVTVYPNPASQLVTITVEQFDERDYQVHIYNSEGRHVYSSERVSSSQIKLDVSQFNPGLYYYKLHNASEKGIIAGKIVIQ